MKKNKLTIKIVSMLFIMLATILNLSSYVKAKSSYRVYGKDRIETSINISKTGWKSGSDVVVIAQGFNYADALCSSPLAKKYNAPILLTGDKKLGDTTIKELKRLNTKKVIIIGGPKIISENVEKQLKDIQIKDVKRIYGANRYETSLKIAENISDNKEIFLTSGNGYADSLSIASIAAKKSMPILFVDKNKLDDKVKNFIQKKSINKIYVIGGETIISNKAISSLKNTYRIYGKDRFETNKNVIEKFKDDINFENVYVVQGAGTRGNEFADALSCSVLASKSSSPIVLTYKDIDENLKNMITGKLVSLSKIIAIGGESVVSSKIVDKLQLKDINTITIDKDNTTLGDEKITKIINGDLVVDADNSTVQNVDIKGVLTINPGEKGTCYIENITANMVVVKSGSKNSIHIRKSKINNLIINSMSNVRIELNEDATINNTSIRSNAILENVKGSFGNITVGDTDENSLIELKGVFNKFIEVNSKIKMELRGEFKGLNINNDCKINVQKSSEVDEIEANSKCLINIEDDAIVNKIKKSNDNVQVNGNVKEVTNNEIKGSTSSGSSTSGSTTSVKSNEFKILIYKDNGKNIIIEKNLKIDKNKSLLDCLKSIATVNESKGLITSINGISNKSISELTESQRKRGVFGENWFITINGKTSPTGADGVNPEEKDVIKFEYREWDWKEIAPGQTKMPIKVSGIPSNIKSGESIKLKVTCVYQPIYDAVIKVNGKEIARTDIKGYATIKISSSGQHTICVEKETGYIKKIVEVKGSSSGGTSGGGSTSGGKVPSTLITVEGKAPLKIVKNNVNEIDITIDGNKYNGEVTITLFDNNNNLGFIGQATSNNKEIKFKTKLDYGKYYGVYRINGLEKIKIPNFEVK